MKENLTSTSTAEPVCRPFKEGTTEIDPAWHKDQIDAYTREFRHYQAYAQVLERILKHACELYAPLAIVQSRPKTVSSFAEKAIRKADKYPCPATQITDLCGARAITETQGEANDICEFIKTSFVVDEPNSPDVRARLKETEFGYLSFHYVVQMKRSDLLRKIVTRSEFREIGERKAEIQVRTILQHAWASITHDRLYKSELKFPRGFQRTGAMQSAALEEADEGFARFIRDFDAYVGNHLAYMTREKIEQEIAALKLVLENEPVSANKPETALRIARMARSAGDYMTAVEVLRSFKNTRSRRGGFIRMELGHALCQISRKNPRGKNYKNGQGLLESVAKTAAEHLEGTGPGKKQDRVILATVMSLLAWSYANVPDRDYRARDFYREALALEPSNPYYLASLLELEIRCGLDHDLVGAMKPALMAALETCRIHADLGIELPRAFFTMGKVHLLMGQHYDALDSYAKGVQICLSTGACIPEDTFKSELEFLSRVNPGKEQLPFEYEWVRRLLLLGNSLKVSPDEVSEDVRALAIREGEFRTPVLIVVGGTAEAIRDEMVKYRGYLKEALSSFSGTVISGGTTAGIPGIVGELAEQFETRGTRKFTAIGYLSKHLPSDAPRDMRYDQIVWTDNPNLSPLEPLQNWIDLLCAGIKPADVIVLGINGGRIATFEYQLALTFGATVGVVDYSGRAVSDLLASTDWVRSDNLVQLPNDVATVRAFVNSGRTQLKPPETREKLAELAHEKYLEDNKYQMGEPSMLPWGTLDEGMKESNRQQIDYVEQILAQAGYALRRKPPSKIKIPQFADHEVEVMAEMEHGRWNVERARAGWKHGTDRDTRNKISPYLVPWKDVLDNVRQYDRKAVQDWPAILKEVGLEIYQVERT